MGEQGLLCRERYSRTADLSGADLYGACLWETDLTGAVADQVTGWPEGFDPVVAGVIFAD